ncbi:von Willebrand factor C and EGF domain-containing protein isoform X2 [Amia ocellicauda]|uniref:von Willebrand factor C and EGF domain-containing protein isoform X2 n=1 Tax=Amia ocellicauda TaxID=2972642 RepID=UPI00346411FA
MLALRCLCLCALLSRADCRLLPGARRRAQRLYSPQLHSHRPRSGPHRCQSGGGSVCCPGWAPSAVSGLCLTPVCPLGCGSGLCIAPNLCLCHGGKQGFTCQGEGRAAGFPSDDFANNSQLEGSPASCLSAGCEHTCVMIGGFPVCSCSLGYILAKDGRRCQDVDECSRFSGASLCQQGCRNTLGSFRCHCYNGYQLSANGRTCVTDAPASSGQEGCGQYGCELLCNHGGCELVSRVCPAGFSMTETDSGVTCTDIDECSGGRSPCQQQCLNIAGSYQCSCRAGFYLHGNGRTCVDVDECSSPAPPRCQQRCVNTVGSFHCACRRGYRYSSQRHTCADVNECETLALAVCQHSCRNSPGSFQCLCPDGHKLHPNGRNCTDVDECASPLSSPCAQLCINTLGSFHCHCHHGYSLSSDETSCTVETSPCLTCQSQCPPGMMLLPNGVDCTDGPDPLDSPPVLQESPLLLSIKTSHSAAPAATETLTFPPVYRSPLLTSVDLPSLQARLSHPTFQPSQPSVKMFKATPIVDNELLIAPTIETTLTTVRYVVTNHYVVTATDYTPFVASPSSHTPPIATLTSEVYPALLPTEHPHPATGLTSNILRTVPASLSTLSTAPPPSNALPTSALDFRTTPAVSTLHLPPANISINRVTLYPQSYQSPSPVQLSTVNKTIHHHRSDSIFHESLSTLPTAVPYQTEALTSLPSFSLHLPIPTPTLTLEDASSTPLTPPHTLQAFDVTQTTPQLLTASAFPYGEASSALPASTNPSPQPQVATPTPPLYSHQHSPFISNTLSAITQSHATLAQPSQNAALQPSRQTQLTPSDMDQPSPHAQHNPPSMLLPSSHTQPTQNITPQSSVQTQATPFSTIQPSTHIEPTPLSALQPSSLTSSSGLLLRGATLLSPPSPVVVDSELDVYQRLLTVEHLLRAAPIGSPLTDELAPAVALPILGVLPTAPLPSLSFSPVLTPALCLHQGAQYSEGSSWMDQDCHNCTCMEGSMICHKVTCSVSCTHPAWDPEHCCPTCNRCLYKGQILEDEHTFSPEDDSCTLCLCLGGNVTCLSPACPPVTCAQPVLSECCPLCPVQCRYLDQEYAEGSEFSPPGDGCATCICQNGQVDCYYPPCPVLDCSPGDWVREAGECCPSCAQEEKERGCSVDDNGVEFPVGQIWSTGDPCETCVCQVGGLVVCQRTQCVEVCPHPIRVPGQCCPDCSMGCSYSGMVYENNESFLSHSDPCLTCICLAGSVACSPVYCQPNCTYPFHQEGECCPLCNDCNYEGRKVWNSQTFSPESQPCTQCVCQFGEVSCEEITCIVPCSHPYALPAECCPTCTVCLYEGQALEDGGYYISEVDPCTVCLCATGSVSCEWRGDSCPDPPCGGPLTHLAGQCCPVCPGDLPEENHYPLVSSKGTMSIAAFKAHVQKSVPAPVSHKLSTLLGINRTAMATPVARHTAQESPAAPPEKSTSLPITTLETAHALNPLSHMVSRSQTSTSPPPLAASPNQTPTPALAAHPQHTNKLHQLSTEPETLTREGAEVKGDPLKQQTPGCVFQGLVFPDGSVFSPDSSPCVLCYCENHSVVCRSAVCPVPPGLRAVQDASCCHACPEPMG